MSSRRRARGPGRPGDGRAAGPGRPGDGRAAGPGSPGDGRTTSAARAGSSFVVDPITGETAELRTIQPFQALKQYICPGCNQEIREGTAHVVVVPLRLPDYRRHWHRPCFERAARRR